MKSLNKICLMTFVALTSIVSSIKAEVVDVYDFKMSLKIPRIYNNSSSLGYRKYQIQTIKGYLIFSYRNRNSIPLISVCSLYNKTHKINGNSITYECEVDNEGDYFYPRISYVGNNRLNKFTIPNICFYLIAEPDYNIADKVDEDNSLYIMLSGIGTSYKPTGYNSQVIRTLSGSVSGTIGCGCQAYGHISPTRLVTVDGAGDVTDVASVYGTWKAKWKKTMSREYFAIMCR